MQRAANRGLHRRLRGRIPEGAPAPRCGAELDERGKAESGPV